MTSRNFTTARTALNLQSPSPTLPRPTPTSDRFNTTTVTSTVAPTPLKTSPLSTTVAGSTITASNPSLPDLKQCPSLYVDNTTITSKSNNGQLTSNKASNNGRSVRLNTSDRDVGTVVRVECETMVGSQSVVYLRCLGTGQWNDTVPGCVDRLDVSSFKVYFAIAGVVCGLSFFVLLVLFCYILVTRRKKSSSSSESSGESEKNIYADPYSVTDALDRSTSGKHYARSDITYEKPVVYSTYLNPSFYEDAYDRWRKQELSVSEKLYDSPWAQPRGLKSQMETPDFKWSQTSLRTIGDSGFRKLPRAQLSIDHVSVKSSDTIGPAIGTRLHELRLSQSTTSSYRPQFVPRRSAPIATRDSRRGVPLDETVTGVIQDNESQSTMVEIDLESNDGLTNL